MVKAYYAAKGSGCHTDAVMSVIFDRIAGLVGLLLLGGTTGLFMLHHPVARSVTLSIWLLAALIVVMAGIYFIPAVRRTVGLDWWMMKLPGWRIFRSIDEADTDSCDHKMTVAGAVALAVVNHTVLVTSATLSTYALGVQHGLWLMAAVLPVLFFVMAIPITYHGLGIVEGVGVPLLVAAPWCTAHQLIGMLMLVRLYMIIYSLLG